MSFMKEIVEKARADYKKEANKTTIELMFINKSSRKGSIADAK